MTLLTEYEFDEKDQLTTISGRTDNFKTLAEQMIIFKSAKMFTTMKLDDIDRDENGQINFRVKASSL